MNILLRPDPTEIVVHHSSRSVISAWPETLARGPFRMPLAAGGQAPNPAGWNKGFWGNFPAVHCVNAIVLTAKNKLKILKAIVLSVAVFMMNMLRRREGPSEVPLHNKAVFINIVPVMPNRNVAVLHNDATALPISVFWAPEAKPSPISAWPRAKEVSVFAIGISLKNLATKGACFCNHIAIVSCGS